MTFVHRSADKTTILARDGGSVLELINSGNSPVTSFGIARVSVAPNIKAAAHWHERTEEVYFIISGHATTHLGDQSHELGPGDAVCIPKGMIHCLENTGGTPVEYIAISSPSYDERDMFWPAEK